MPSSPFSRISFLFALGLVLAVLNGVQDVAASSRAPGPLKRIFHPRGVSLEIVPRSIPSHPGHPLKNKKRSDIPSGLLLPSDALRLSLSLPNLAFGGDEDDVDVEDRVHLHLSPTEDLIHPQAKINYLSSSGEILSSTPLFAHDHAHRLYSGEVIAEGFSDKRFEEDKIGNGGLWYHPASGPERGVRGWASIHVYESGLEVEGVNSERPMFGGTINVDGRVWNVMTRENYQRHRQEFDPVVMEESEDGEMVIFLEGDHHPNPRDAYTHAHKDTGAETTTGCGHDKIEWNMDNTTHPVRRPRTPAPVSPWWSSSAVDSLPDLFADYPETPRTTKLRRDDIPTGGTTNPNTNYINSIGSTSGCPGEQRVVYVGFAADCNYVGTYGGAEQARTQILTNMNSVSNLYRQTFNISLGIIELNVVNDTCATSSSGALPWNVECSNTITLNERLSLFSQWRGSSGTPDAGLYHLATACATDTEIGVAWLGTICQTGSNQQSSGFVSGTGVSVATRSEWSLISHEMGHNFGAIHDCTSACSLSGSCCPFSSSSCDAGQRYIMNPSTSTSDPQVMFSPCSVGNICSLMQQNALDYSCVVPPGGRTVLSLQSCGNGILEDGEDCDPGSDGSSPCCDSATCRFINGAVCDPATDACCTGQCAYASNSTLCRASVDENCDTPEYCTGSSRSCPSDRTAEDGTGCGNGLACASGQCTSNDLQCRTVGASRNLTQACNQRGDRSCVVSCQDPQSSNRCLILQSPLIDGSPCGYGGNCYNGTCSSGSVGEQVSSWYTQNKNISIPVTVVGGLIILLILFAIGRCIFRGCCGGGRRSRKSHHPVNRPTSSSSVAPMTQNQRMSTGYAPPPGGYPYTGQYGPAQSFGNQAPPYYDNGYGGYGGPQQPAPVQAGREHYIDDRLYNGSNYRGH